MDTGNTPTLFTIEGAVERWGGTPSHWTLRRKIKEKKIKTIRIGARVLIPLEEIRRIEREGL